MGSDEAHNTGGELPPHNVCFDEPYWIDVFEVTQAQFAEFGGEAALEPCCGASEHPRDCITWFKARDFCELRGARLPTEAEWEFVARGPEAWKLPWGEDQAATKQNAVYPGNTFDGHQPVGSKPGGESWVGAHDISGNVWEWLGNWYGEFYYFELDDGHISPQGPEDGTQRVLRGGSWLSPMSIRTQQDFCTCCPLLQPAARPLLPARPLAAGTEPVPIRSLEPCVIYGSIW